MSRENLESVWRMWDALAAGSFPVDAFADDVEWHLARDIPDTGVCRGPAEIAHMLTESQRRTSERTERRRWKPWGCGSRGWPRLRHVCARRSTASGPIGQRSLIRLFNPSQHTAQYH